jgi:ribosome-binding protein aMBF1 (putative translation factor)
MSKTQRNIRRRIRSKKHSSTTDAVAILDAMTGSDSGLRRLVRDAEADLEVAQMIHDARTSAGLTQAQLARLVGTTQSVISRLEDADYTGHTLSLLRRVAAALGKRLKLQFSPGAAA